MYQIECNMSKKDGKRKVYIGETGRSVYERTREHWRDWRDKKMGSSLCTLEEWEYMVKVLRKLKTPLEIQILEGVLIVEEKLDVILNSKGKYGHNVIPRIRIEVGTWIMRDEELELFRRQRVDVDLEEGEEREREEGRQMAVKRDGEILEPSKAKS